MGIIGVLWVIFVALKALSLISTSWLIVLLWPIVVSIILFFIALIFGVTIAGISARS